MGKRTSAGGQITHTHTHTRLIPKYRHHSIWWFKGSITNEVFNCGEKTPPYSDWAQFFSKCSFVCSTRKASTKVTNRGLIIIDNHGRQRPLLFSSAAVCFVISLRHECQLQKCSISDACNIGDLILSGHLSSNLYPLLGFWPENIFVTNGAYGFHTSFMGFFTMTGGFSIRAQSSTAYTFLTHGMKQKHKV